MPVNGSRPALPSSPVGSPDVLYGSAGYGSMLTEWSESVPDLTWPESIRTFGRMRRDPKLTAVLSAFYLPILRCNWAVDPEGVKNARAVDLVAGDLGLPVLGAKGKPPAPSVPGFRWGEHVRLALLHLPFGFMPFEQWYAPASGGDNLTHLAGLAERQPHTIASIDVGDDGQVRAVEQNTQTKPITANRLLWYVHDREGANWAGVSLLRSCYTSWLLKHEVLRVHATAHRRWGVGVPVVHAPPGGTPAQVTEAHRLATGMRAGDQAGAGLPDGFTFEIAGMTGSAPDAVAFLNFLNQEMVGSALAKLLELGSTSEGSRALGDTFMDLFLLALQSAADALGDTFTYGDPAMPGVSRALTEYNFGDGEVPPRIVATDVGDRHEITAAAIQQLVACGAIQVDDEIEGFIRDAWSLPKRKTPRTPPPAPGGPGAGPAPGGGGAPGEQPPPGGQPAPAEAQPGGGGGNMFAPLAAAAGGLRRPLTPVEAASGLDPAAIHAELTTAVDRLLAQWAPVAAEQRADLAEQVSAAVDAGRIDRLPHMTADSGRAAALLFAAMRQAAAKAAARMIAEAAAQGVDIDPAAVKLDEKRLGKLARARAAMAAGYLAAQASRRALQVVTASAGTEAAREVTVTLAGLSPTSLADELLGAMHAAANAGRLAVLDAGPDAVYTASEILDGNTCGPCAAIDGHTFAGLDDANAAYGNGAYTGCLGQLRCRGTVVATWPQEPRPFPGKAAAAAEYREDQHPRDGDGKWTSKPGLEDADAEPLTGQALWDSPEGRVAQISPAEVEATGRVWYSAFAPVTNEIIRDQYTNPEARDAAIDAYFGPSFHTDVAAFTGLIRRSPPFTRDAVMYRAVKGAAKIFGRKATGKTITDSGFVSLSASQDAVKPYGDTLVRVRVPAGTRALRADERIWATANHGLNAGYSVDQVQEYTLLPGSSFTVTGDRKENGQRIIDVTITHAGPPAGSSVSAAGGRPVNDGRPDLAGLPGGERFGWQSGDVEIRDGDLPAFGDLLAAVLHPPDPATAPFAALVEAAFREADHPRRGKGQKGGGQFTRKQGPPAPRLTVTDYEGTTGSREHITRTETGTIPTAALARLRGREGEKPGEHRNRQGPAWEAFKRDIARNGITSPVFVTVDHGEEPRISEGSHRRDAAVELGLPTVPVEIRYFGHAEQQGTVTDRAAQPEGGPEYKSVRVTWRQHGEHGPGKPHYVATDDRYQYEIIGGAKGSGWRLTITDRRTGKTVQDTPVTSKGDAQKMVDEHIGPAPAPEPPKPGIATLDAVRRLADEDRTADGVTSRRLGMAMDALQYGRRDQAAADVEKAAFNADLYGNTGQAGRLRDIARLLALPEPEPGPAPEPVVRRPPAPHRPEGTRGLAAWLSKVVYPAASQAVKDIYGTDDMRWDGRVKVAARMAANAQMDWDGTMELQSGFAQDIGRAFDRDPAARPRDGKAVAILLHEEHHAVGGQRTVGEDARDYLTKPGKAQEEGFTELGAWLELSQFLDKAGIAGKETTHATDPAAGQRESQVRFIWSRKNTILSRLDREYWPLREKVGGGRATPAEAARYKVLGPAIGSLTGLGVGEADMPAALDKAIGALNDAGYPDDAATLAGYRDRLAALPPRYETLGEWAARVVNPGDLYDPVTGWRPDGMNVAYPDWTRLAYRWCDDIAKLEARRDGKPAGTLESRYPRVREIARDVNRRSGPGKRRAMAVQLLKALGVDDTAQPVTVAGQERSINSQAAEWVNEGWARDPAGYPAGLVQALLKQGRLEPGVRK